MKNIFNNVLITFVIKSLIISTIAFLLLIMLFSRIVLSFDLETRYYSIFGYIILFIASWVTAVLSTLKFKNSLMLMCSLSNIPLIILSIICSINNKSFVQFIISCVLVMISCTLGALFNAKHTKRLKV